HRVGAKPARTRGHIPLRAAGLLSHAGLLTCFLAVAGFLTATGFLAAPGFLPATRFLIDPRISFPITGTTRGGTRPAASLQASPPARVTAARRQVLPSR